MGSECKCTETVNDNELGVVINCPEINTYSKIDLQSENIQDEEKFMDDPTIATNVSSLFKNNNL